MNWFSPTTQLPLAPDTPHSLSDGEARWPVADGIPYLRTGRDEMVAQALARLDADDAAGALVLLLADQDNWWTGPRASDADLRRLVAERDTLTLREAMVLLAWGPVADYFAHRWSDPTYLAGLALLEAHWNEPRAAFELACGIGHYARELTRRGVACLGADVVFAKCWVAKHWVAPEAEFVCFDAAAPWPTGERRFDLVHCQDAFYFLPDQGEMAERLRAAVAADGVMAVGHLHNAGVAGGAMGPAKSAAQWRALFPRATAYDEGELLAALLEARAPRPADWPDGPEVEAWSLAEGGGAPRSPTAGLALPLEGAQLRPNPLLATDGPHWPSPRYGREYGPRSTWATGAGDPVLTRQLVDLPERW